MKILIAKNAGFCMGVRRAVEMVLDAPNKYKNPICTFGPLIHNPQVLTLLKEKGICSLNNIPEHGSGTVLIRAHGVPPETKKNLKKAGFEIVDATCPRVVKVQTIIRRHSKQGYACIIVGDKDHPEVTGLLGYSGGNGYVVDSINGLDSLAPFEKAIIVFQTTQNTLFFETVKNWAGQKFPHYKIFDTICDSTARRQAEVHRLADSVDAVIVVGGHNSGNTKRLAEIARRSGKQTYHIEEESELDLEALSSARNIGITAGASTPNWIIEKIHRTLETLPVRKGSVLRHWVFALLRTLMFTNIYVSLGAGGLAYACSKIQSIANYLPYVVISILYVQSMHILNNFTGTKTVRYNDPDRFSFYQKNKKLLSLLAFTAGGGGLITAYTLGLIPFLVMLFMVIMGISYNLRFVPKHVKQVKYKSIRDVPGSKTIVIAVAWGVVTSLLPSLSVSTSVPLRTAAVFLWSLSLVFVKTAFFDILDMQSDRILGKETIPILVGEKRIFHLLKLMLAINIGILLFSGIFHLIPNLGFALAICPISIFIVITAYQKDHFSPGIKLKFLIENVFVLAGVITLVWSLYGSLFL